MGIASDQEFIGHSFISGLMAAGSSWYLSDVPADGVTSTWPYLVAGVVLLFSLEVWAFPDTYSNSDRHPVLYGCFGGIPILLASYWLHGTAYSTLSMIYLWAGSISLILGISIPLLHIARQKFGR